jgi:hypothetical protein
MTPSERRMRRRSADVNVTVASSACSKHLLLAQGMAASRHAQEISKDPAMAARLKSIFETRGTLMFSVVNILEMAANTGQS